MQGKRFQRTQRIEASHDLLKAELGNNFASWVVDSARCLGMVIVPGEYFVLTRDILVYSPHSFLTTGLLGLCGTALHPKLARRPYLSGVLLPGGNLDPLTYACVGSTPPSRWRLELYRNVGYAAAAVRSLFGYPSQYTDSGEQLLEAAVNRGRLADYRPYLPRS